MMQKHRSKWLDRCAVELTYCYRLCVTEKDFYAELKRLKIPKSAWPKFIKTPQAHATLHYFEASGGDLCAIVCLRKDEAKKRPPDQIYGLLVHEAMHLWRACKEHIGETDPSSEFEAYAMQRISQNLIYSWMDQTK